MEISIQTVSKTSRGLVIWFDDLVFKSSSSDELNEMGKRVLRILRTVAPDERIINPGNDTHGRCLMMEGTTSIKQIESTSAIQALMDTHSKGDIKVHFQEPKLYASENSSTRGDEIALSDLRDALTSGKSVQAHMVFGLSLPALNSDTTAIRDALRDKKYHVVSTSEVENGLKVYFYVYFASRNPLAMMKQLQPRISNALR